MFGRRTEPQIDFKSQVSLTKRKLLSAKIRDRYSDRIPIIIAKVRGAAHGTPQIRKQKFLVPLNFTVQQMLSSVRKEFSNLGPHEAIYLFVGNGVLMPVSSNLESVYKRFVDEDGFLYVYYSAEDTFGHRC